MQPESFNVHFTIASEVLQALTGGLTTLAALAYLFVGGCVSGLLMRHFTSQPMSLWRWPEKLAAGAMTALWPAAVPGVPLWFLAATAWRTAKAPAAAGVRLAYGNKRREADAVAAVEAFHAAQHRAYEAWAQYQGKAAGPQLHPADFVGTTQPDDGRPATNKV